MSEENRRNEARRKKAEAATKDDTPIKPSDWFTNIGGWLVVYGEDGEGKKQSKQFGDCTSSNLLFSALKKMNGKEEEPPSYKLLHEVVQFLLSVQADKPKLMMYLTITDGCNFQSGFEDIAAMQDGKIVVGGAKKYRKDFRDALMGEIEKHYEMVALEE